jgi:CRP-like cAMP-binding protein
MDVVAQQQLAGLALFEGAAEHELVGLAARLGQQRLGPGDELMREGETGAFFALLAEGRVAISRAAPVGIEQLAEAGAGSVLGELSLLRGERRGATVTALEPCVVLTGGAAELAAMLEVTGVHDRVRRMVSSRLAADARPISVSVRDADLLVRPLVPSDRRLIVAALDTMSLLTRRRRFFTSAYPSEKLLDHLTDIDYVDHFAWVVVDPASPDVGVAVARCIRDEDDERVAEAAFTVHDDYQGRGLGTILLGALGAAARLAGVDSFTASMLADNDAMRGVFDKADVHFTFGEPGVVIAHLSTARCADLLAPAPRVAFEAAARDIVTAAGLALTHPTTKFQ